MRKRERQEKLLGCTLSESLILFLFILLTIANIYRKIIEDGKLLVPGFKQVPGTAIVLGPDFMQITQNEYKNFKKSEERIDDLEDTIVKTNSIIKTLKKDIVDKKAHLKDQKVAFDNHIKNQKENTEIRDKLGVSTPACKLDNGETFVLFDVDYLSDTTYVLTFKNLTGAIGIRQKNKRTNRFETIYVHSGDRIKLNHQDFKRFGQKMVDSKRINQNDQLCYEGSPSDKQSAYCLECQYVYHVHYEQYKITNLIKKKVRKELALFMNNTVNLYFYSSMTFTSK